MLKFAILGGKGRMGTLRSSIIKDLGHRYSVFDGEDITAETLSGEKFDGYFVCTPLKSHYDLISGLASKNKPIFVEKPLFSSIDQIREIIGGEFSKSPIYVGWQRRKDPLLDRVRENIGDWKKIEIISMDNPSPPPHVLDIPNYLIEDFVGHDFDEAVFLTDIIPESVETHLERDNVRVKLKFRGDREVEIFGQTHNPEGNYYHQEVRVDGELRTVDSKTYNKYSFPEYYEAAFRIEVEEFVGICAKHKKNLFDTLSFNNETFVENLTVKQITQAAILSSKENRPVNWEEVAG